jgi:hypothetical protein
VTVAHLDHDGANDAPDNLAWLCWSHHRMYDGGLYPREAIGLLQAHWQRTRGAVDFKACLKAAGTSEAARKAAATRKARASAGLAGLAPTG